MKGVLIIMWYVTGSGKATMQGSKMATRMYMMRARSIKKCSFSSKVKNRSFEI